MRDQYGFRPCLRDASRLVIKATDKQAIAIAARSQCFQYGFNKTKDWWSFIGAEHARQFTRHDKRTTAREIVNAGDYGHYILE